MLTSKLECRKRNASNLWPTVSDICNTMSRHLPLFSTSSNFFDFSNQLSHWLWLATDQAVVSFDLALSPRMALSAKLSLVAISRASMKTNLLNFFLPKLFCLHPEIKTLSADTHQDALPASLAAILSLVSAGKKSRFLFFVKRSSESLQANYDSFSLQCTTIESAKRL